MGQLRQHIGRRRGDEHQVGLLGQGDMLDLVGEIPVEGIEHRAVARQGFKGQGGDKLRRVPRHHDSCAAL